MNARNAGPSPALRIIAALIGALVAGVIGWLAHDATFGAAFASATALVVSVFAGDLWILTPSYKRDRQAALDARSALVQAIRDAEATKERGWLIRFSCFPTGTTADAFIPYFEAASNFDPEQYLQAIEALDRAMESRYKEDRLRDAKNFARVEWQAEAARNHHPSI
ncbi:hypothetical protein E4T66_18090 [Sinimarinibacterium sp. CAU 1509]|uniref:hypothetical protein n=1 Tax=Sinimarinibacterium sp. CAU 1509 TaxID=2562283 RepID=UPI0010AD3D4D|nr:hypothetical protein [Sinimarinibacterium sp. CAU 1509]TJY57316.1 hypothetical protein E4T66_18090 [Sinimarinibacterium sp. CAU 1509]